MGKAQRTRRGNSAELMDAARRSFAYPAMWG